MCDETLLSCVVCIRGNCVKEVLVYVLFCVNREERIPIRGSLYSAVQIIILVYYYALMLSQIVIC